jgi:pimeloyl-ACP methyl ester carboxylesterase
MVLAPGWASDYKVFQGLDLDYNYIIPEEFSPWDIVERLGLFLKSSGIERVSLFGWSMGGFALAEFAAKYPGSVESLMLAGIRVKYDVPGLSEIKEQLKRSKAGYLYKFYAQSFQNKDAFSSFKKGLMKEYIKDLDLDELLNTLEYLERAAIDPRSLGDIEKIKIIHGREDRIAPVDEAMRIKEGLPNAELVIIDGAGHMVFSESDLRSYV